MTDDQFRSDVQLIARCCGVPEWGPWLLEQALFLFPLYHHEWNAAFEAALAWAIQIRHREIYRAERLAAKKVRAMPEVEAILV